LPRNVEAAKPMKIFLATPSRDLEAKLFPDGFDLWKGAPHPKLRSFPLDDKTKPFRTRSDGFVFQRRRNEPILQAIEMAPIPEVTKRSQLWVGSSGFGPLETTKRSQPGSTLRPRSWKMTKRSQPGLASSHQITVRDKTKPTAILADDGLRLLWADRMGYGDGFPGASAVDSGVALVVDWSVILFSQR